MQSGRRCHNFTRRDGELHQAPSSGWSISQQRVKTEIPFITDKIPLTVLESGTWPCDAGKAPSCSWSVAVSDGLHGEEADVHFGLDVDSLPHLQGRGEQGRVLAGIGEQSEAPTFRKSSKVMPSYTSSGPCAQQETNHHSCTHSFITPLPAPLCHPRVNSHRAGHARAGRLQHGPLSDGPQ